MVSIEESKQSNKYTVIYGYLKLSGIKVLGLFDKSTNDRICSFVTLAIA